MHCRTGKIHYAPILAVLICLLAGWHLPARAAQLSDPKLPTMDLVNKPWKGDLDQLMKRRAIRVLVTYNKTNYFFDGAHSRGVTVEVFEKYAKEINERYKKGHLKAHMIYIPVSRDQLIPYLVQGKGDIVAANMTITSKRAKQADFTDAVVSGVKELVVTSPKGPRLKNLEDLSGKQVLVRKSSSYYQSLKKLNAQFKNKKLAPVKIILASEDLETEDILELVNSNMFGITIADDYLANFWKKIFKGLRVHQDLQVRSGAKIAWMVRKGSKQLKASLNRFIKNHRQGTLFGNVVLKRYFEDTKFVRDAFTPEHMKRFNSTVDFFRKYAKRYSFDYLMITALAYQESKLDQNLRSQVGAVGVMQVLPSTAKGPAVNISQIHKLEANIHAGTKYLRHIYDTYFKNIKNMSQEDKVLLTFASYNAGPTKISGLRKRTEKMGLNPNKWFGNVEVAAAKAIGRETVQYVSNIFKYYFAYRQVLARQKTAGQGAGNKPKSQKGKKNKDKSGKK